MPVFIEVKNLTVDFDGLKALKNVSLSINEGEIVGVLGKSGSGKTILMHVLRGTESFENISGEVIYPSGPLREVRIRRAPQQDRPEMPGLWRDARSF